MDELADTLTSTPSAKQWSRFGVKHRHGINVPLFALHTQNSAGIGEYPDLIPLLTWCKSLDLDIVQLLPLNDTGEETSPYGSLSAFALNPIHLGLATLPNLQSSPLLVSLLKEAQKLTICQRVCYQKLHLIRESFLKEYFTLFGQEIRNSKEYQDFISENHDWLPGFALFKAIKICCHWQSWEEWPDEYKLTTPQALEQQLEKYEIDVSYHQFVQFLCFQQMKAVKTHAENLGIYLKGDLPILINRESADVWLHRDLFNMELSAGAPPDHYSDEGQNWGFPLYNWTAMEQQGYGWWKRRLSVAANFYHIYRLDHVVGFYRIWGIAKDKKPLEGRFVPEDRSSWVDHGEKILTMMLTSSSMLPIGEDLGTIPNEVRQNLRKLGICGTKVMRWERNWTGDGKFISPDKYDSLSMTTVSTHDSTPLPLWWVQSPDESKEYALERGWEYKTPLISTEHFAYLYDSHHSKSIFHINLLNEYLALFPELIWPSLEDERINTPGIISANNWTYRCRCSLEQIVDHSPLAYLIMDLKA